MKKRSLKMILALILSMTMLMGMCLTAMAVEAPAGMPGTYECEEHPGEHHYYPYDEFNASNYYAHHYDATGQYDGVLDNFSKSTMEMNKWYYYATGSGWTECTWYNTPDPAPAKPAEPAKKSEPAPVPVHTHSYSWKTLSAPTTVKDGVEGLACECGDVIETQPISAEGYTLDLNTQVIRLAGSGAPVVVDLGNYNVLPRWFVKKLVERDDLNITLKITYDHKNYVLEVPKTATIEDESIEWYGPLKLMSMFPQK